ncbi:MAG TPA: hypothetical protein VIE89_19245 [Candidatus Binatia bacterium]
MERFVMPERIAGIWCTGCTGDIRVNVNLDCSAPCWNDAIGNRS